MKDEASEKPCECGMPHRYAQDEKCPVEFDERLHELNVIGDGRSWKMRYCFWCGGKLPESRRDERYSELEAGEVEELKSVVANIKSFDDAIRVLGEPDERFAGDGNLCPETLRYSSRWKSLVLNIQQKSDGRPAISFQGQYIPTRHPEVTPDRPWWHFLEVTLIPPEIFAVPPSRRGEHPGRS